MSDDPRVEPEVLSAPSWPGPQPTLPPFDWVRAPARRKFQHDWQRHILLFLLTFFTTTFSDETFVLVISPILWVTGGQFFNPLQLFTFQALIDGLKFSVPLLLFLSAHEFGHYFACRLHNVDATLPYYIPAPVPLTGTFGAVIRIKEAFPSKAALFDIGVAGPIAGFVVLFPILVWSIWTAHVAPLPPGPQTYFGEPLLLKGLAWLRFGARPEGTDLFLSSMGIAAWWGMLATALNLLPFGQLDGGHIMYAAVGRHASRLSIVTLSVVVLLMLNSATWFMPALMMVAMALFFGFRHPRIIDEHEPLDVGRQVIAVFALVIFVLCFTPVPVEMLGE